MSNRISTTTGHGHVKVGGGTRSHRSISFQFIFFTGLVTLTLVFTAHFNRLQKYSTANIQFVDKRASSSSSDNGVSSEFQMEWTNVNDGNNDDDGNGNDDDGGDKLQDLQTDKRSAGSISGRPVITKPPRKKKTGRSSSTTESSVSFQGDAFETLEWVESSSSSRGNKRNKKKNKKKKRNKKKKNKKKKKGGKKSAHEKLQQIMKRTNNKRVQSSGQDYGALQVAWIMSFGGSGTSYTIANTQKMSNTTAATNYAYDFDTCVPVRPDLVDGPCVRSPEMDYPPTFILTKTHCGGYCMQCAPKGYIHTVDSFEKACRTGQLNIDGKTVTKTYASGVPKKAVHIIRNPFDNLVGRQHLAMKKRERKEPGLEVFSSSKEGMKSWCAYLDAKMSPKEVASKLLDQDMLERYKDLPCRSEWFRYIQWHSLTIQVTQQLGLPYHSMYYEDYGTDHAATVKDLFGFLELPIVEERLEFRTGKTYSSFFELEDAELAARMVRELATPEAWALLRHYFVDIVGQDFDDAPTGALAVAGGDEVNRSDEPKVAWLLSFPNSGTTFTILNTEYMSNSSMATNYAHESRSAVPIPVRSESANGPFLRVPELGRPSYALTKTHCGGYCNDCPPRRYVLTTDSFEQDCASGRMGVGKDMAIVEYSPTIPSKIVHLIRNPFDNLVARLHMGVNKREKRGEDKEELAKFSSSKEGFRNWCKNFDEKYAQQEKDSPLLDQSMVKEYADLPCHAEWYRFVQWHNLAVEVSKKRNLPVHMLYYEDYTTRFNATVDGLLEFLELPVIQEPLDFIPGKTYQDFYDFKDARLAARFVHELATPQVWLLLRHYFTDFLDDTDATPKLPPASELGVERATRPAVAWLMSFPNSGTSFTISNTEHMSNSSTATNYAKGREDALPVRQDLTDGPFLHKPFGNIPQYVMTKTHCTGYCDECPAKKYVHTLDSFIDGCTLSHKPVGDDSVNVHYDASVPERAIHLLRDPFDNTKARLHLALKKRKRDRGWSDEKAAEYRTKEGFQAWCGFLDQKFDDTDMHSPLIDDHVKELLQGVPCRAEWYRYTQWHNLAIATTQRLNLPVHVLYYESYTDNFDATVKDLFEFLELPVVKDPLPFIPGKTYKDDFYEADQIEAAKRLVRALATDDCWALLKRYFED